MNIDLKKYQKAEARWLILRTLAAGRPIGATVSIIVSILEDSSAPLDSAAIRCELDYLEGKGLARIEDRTAEDWRAVLTPAGVDVVEYDAPAPTGIRRPAKA